MSEDYYKILDVERDATAEDIKKAYRNLAKKYHPDRNKDDEDAASQFKKISEAYEILGDEFKKNQYDRFGRVLGENEMGPFSQGRRGNTVVFNFGNFNFRKPFEKTISPTKVEARISIAEAFNGKKNHKIIYHRMDICPSCNGTGCAKDGSVIQCQSCRGTGEINFGGKSFLSQQCAACGGSGERVTIPCETCKGGKAVLSEKKLSVSLPPGTLNGNMMSIKDVGNYCPYNKRYGDLYVLISIMDEEFMKVDEFDLKIGIPITLKEAIFGCKKLIPNPHGKIEVKIPKGVSPGSVLKISGKGMRRGVNLDSYGDLFVIVDVEIPIVDDSLADKFDESEFKYVDVKSFEEYVKKGA